MSWAVKGLNAHSPVKKDTHTHTHKAEKANALMCPQGHCLTTGGGSRSPTLDGGLTHMQRLMKHATAMTWQKSIAERLMAIVVLGKGFNGLKS